MHLTDAQVANITRLTEEGMPFIARCDIRVLALDYGYCKLRLPLEPNRNHLGTMYAGALFSVAELTGGVIFLTAFDASRFYPLVADMRIRYLRPAREDVTVEQRLNEQEISRIRKEAEQTGKSRFGWEQRLLDETGQVVATTENHYQLRRLGP